MAQHSLSRTELLIGSNGLKKLSDTKIVVFGVGGVGSFSIEALVRSGIGHITIVDDDTVCLTNLNRQIHADYDTIGKPKVEVMKQRILKINPKCSVDARQTFVKADNIDEIIAKDTDYVIDAIDTVSSKIALIEWCAANNIKIISSMGTGNKFDPTRFQITDIYKTSMCPLAKVMRYELKKRRIKKLKVLFSDEMPVKPQSQDSSTEEQKRPSKRQTPGSISYVPPVAGMIIASEVVNELLGIKK